MKVQINIVIALLMVLIGFGFIIWSVAQMTFVIPFYSDWSDVAGLAMGITSFMMAFMAYTDLQTIELRT
ncbi:hypothetical protein [Caballeronia sp. LZ034LL]|uniref:hypothetical protein n=1 Tax=Caballeronia sp. LZ034LL TaxID=3038567 RepID=UPI00285D1890|nr:hypothetical protein [Caballeronia sp. LZ034LL]MDR5839338.1 hypothetical protein [Caballeronia sp. LZ034LL]